VTEQDPPVGPPDLPLDDGSRILARARGGQTSGIPSHGTEEADVIVVGAGPAGSAVAYYLASAGLDVLVLEKSRFPREKVCGDGLTPRAVKALTAMGVPTTGEGWLRNKGLRIIGGGGRIELDWPDLSSYPGYGLVRNRMDFDETLARHAEQAGARLLEGINVTGPVLDDRTGAIIGVTAQEVAGGKDAPPRTFTGRLVVAADGNSSRLSVAMGLRKRDDRPLGVAVRTYYQSPRHDDDYLEAWLDLWDGDMLLPGYGWIFGMGDGTSNVGVGLLNTSAAFQNIDYRALLRRWLATMPPEWGFSEDNRTEPVRGAALPMGFNRTPHYTRGLLLAGDSGGMVNPFNGEGIAYALESGEIAARVITQALARPSQASAELVLRGYPRILKDSYGGYYTLGRVFVELIGKPSFMRFATRHSIKRPAVMRFTMKLLGNLTETRGGDPMDRLLNAVSKMTPAA
jgi:menaquinone-9 beta-reductase